MTPRSTAPIIITGSANKPFARKLAKELDWALGDVEIAHFSDQETHAIVKSDVHGRDVYIVQPTSMPTNETFMELLIIAHAARSLKPSRMTAVMPFVGYRRQEKTTQKGESLTFELIARLMKASGIERVLVIDLHKHRSAKYFKQARIACRELRAFEVLVKYFKKKKLENFVMLAPDKGSIPESERYAHALGVPLVKVFKHRSKRDQVVIDKFEGDVTGKNVLIVDDEINTAGTLCGVVELLKKKKARNIYFGCTHAVLSGPAMERIATARLKQVVITDTILLPQEKRIQKMKILSVTPLFADAMRVWAKRA